MPFSHNKNKEKFNVDEINCEITYQEITSTGYKN